MSSRSADRQLLFGLLGLQNGLVSRDQLVAAFAQWTSDKSLKLDDVFIADGSLTTETCDRLRQMVELHIELHGGDPYRSLMTLPSSDLRSARRNLEALNDSDLRQSIAQLPEHTSPAAEAVSMGKATSEGGRFRILRPLEDAHGGMGVISVARDEELGRYVALKQIRSDKADEKGFRQKFQVEAEITGNLEHPSIVPIYGLGASSDGRPYYAMRLVHGDDFGKTIRQFHERRASGRADYNSVEFRGLVDRLIDVAQAIRYAHSRGVLHRDLKPGNILVGEYGETLVIDWGLARLPRDAPTAKEQPEVDTFCGLDETGPLSVRSGSAVAATLEGSILGTPGYAPPEQVSGRTDQINERSDVYSLGAILYQILTGRAPITGPDEDRDLSALMKDTIEGRIKAPREVLSSIPKSLSAVCMKSLSREPADRYESVEALIAEIEHWKADQPVSAAPDSIADRVMRWARHYRAAALATAATVTGIAIVAGIALVVVNRARVNEAAAAKRNHTVVDSFVAAFRSADPENEGVTGSMTALEVLEQALATMEDDDELQKDPLAKATLLAAIGDSLQGLGAYNQAISAYLVSCDLRKTHHGPDHPDTLTDMNKLASAYTSAGRLDKALQFYEETLKLSKAKLGSDHHTTLTSMNDLASTYELAGRLDEALPLHEETLKLSKAKLGPDHPDTLVSMNNLALAYKSAGRLDEALPLYEETFKLSKATLGPDHPEMLIRMNNLAIAYESAGRLEEALPLHEETLKLKKAKLGPDHPSTLTSMNNLAVAYWSAGRLDEALPLYEKALKLRKAKLGPDHPHTLSSMGSLAVAYASAGRLDEALPLYEETLKLEKAKLGPEHPSTMSSMNNLALAYKSAGRLDEALPLYAETLRHRKAKLGPEHPDTLNTFRGLQSAAMQNNRFEFAENVIREWLAVLEGMDPPQPEQTARAKTSLSSALIGQGKLDESISAARSALEISDVDQTQRARARNILGSSLAHQDKWREAEPLLTESCRSLIGQLNDLPSHFRWYVPSACQRVIDMYDAWGKRDKVNEWQEELDRVNAEIDRLRQPQKLAGETAEPDRADERQ